MTNLPPVDGLRVVPTVHTVRVVIERIESLASKRAITVFARIDFSADAARSGLALRPTVLVILGNPKAGTPMITATPTVAIDLPLKVLAWEDAVGGTWIAYNEPAYLRERHHFPSDLEGNTLVIGELVAAAARPDG